jgi:hypothetical protein
LMRRAWLEDKIREQLKIFKDINKYWKNGLKNDIMQSINIGMAQIIYYLIRIT